MIDRDEFLRFRIENYLDQQRARLQKIQSGFGTLAVRQTSNDSVRVGAFAPSKREFKNGDRHHFIETSMPGSANSRQLWLPAQRWDGPYSTVLQREIIITVAQPARRFAAWQDAQPSISNVEGYSPYDAENQAIFEEAKLALQFIDANDAGFDFSVDSD